MWRRLWRSLLVSGCGEGRPVAAGWPGESLSEEQAERFQAQVNQNGADFVRFVEKHRESVPEDMARGGTYSGAEAVDNGLADVVSSLEETVADVAAFVA